MNDGDVASAMATRLRHHGAATVFGALDPTGQGLSHRLEEAGVGVVRTLHDQTAVFAADAWARVTRRPGEAVVPGRAGLPNAVTGTANAAPTGTPRVVLDDCSGSGPPSDRCWWPGAACTGPGPSRRCAASPKPGGSPSS